MDMVYPLGAEKAGAEKAILGKWPRVLSYIPSRWIQSPCFCGTQWNSKDEREHGIGKYDQECDTSLTRHRLKN